MKKFPIAILIIINVVGLSLSGAFIIIFNSSDTYGMIAHVWWWLSIAMHSLILLVSTESLIKSMVNKQ